MVGLNKFAKAAVKSHCNIMKKTGNSRQVNNITEEGSWYH